MLENNILIKWLIRFVIVIEAILFMFCLITIGGSDWYLIPIFLFLGSLFAFLIWLFADNMTKHFYLIKTNSFHIVPVIIFACLYLGLAYIGMRSSIIFHTANTERQEKKVIEDNLVLSKNISNINLSINQDNQQISSYMLDISNYSSYLKTYQWLSLYSTNKQIKDDAAKSVTYYDFKKTEAENKITLLIADREKYTLDYNKLKTHDINVKEDVLKPSLKRFGESSVDDMLFGMWQFIYIMLQSGLLAMMFISKSSPKSESNNINESLKTAQIVQDITNKENKAPLPVVRKDEYLIRENRDICNDTGISPSRGYIIRGYLASITLNNETKIITLSDKDGVPDIANYSKEYLLEQFEIAKSNYDKSVNTDKRNWPSIMQSIFNIFIDVRKYINFMFAEAEYEEIRG